MSSLTTNDSGLVVVFGGSGFLGRHVVRALAANGYRIRVACRRPDLAGHLQPLGNVGQIQCVQANLRYRWSIDRAVEGADVVINLVGLLSERGKQTFENVHARGAAWVAAATKAQKARLIQVSALGANENSLSDYWKTKAEADRMVRKTLPSTVILRPSVMFGPEDNFFNKFAAMATVSPFLPMIGGGNTKLQPVYVGDVAQAVLQGVQGKLKKGTIYELGGPEVLSFRESMQHMLQAIDRDKKCVTLPFGLARFFAGILQYLPGAPLTPDQVEMLKFDNVVSKSAIKKGSTLEGMGLTPTRVSNILPSYMVRFREHGQFEANRGL